MSAPSQRTVMRGACDCTLSSACAARYELMLIGSRLTPFSRAAWNPLIGADSRSRTGAGAGEAATAGRGAATGALATEVALIAAWLDHAVNVGRSGPISMRTCLLARLI